MIDMNEKGQIPPVWFIFGLIFIAVSFIVGGVALLIQTGFYYIIAGVIGVILKLITNAIAGSQQKITGKFKIPRK